MEFIQWFSGTSADPSKSGGEIVDIARHAMFKLDEFDFEILNGDTKEWVKAENEEYIKEHEDIVQKDKYIIMVTEDAAENGVTNKENDQRYKDRCLDIFKQLIDVQMTMV